MLQSYNLPIAETIEIWANSLSLATTQEITIVFFSTGYLGLADGAAGFRQGFPSPALLRILLGIMFLSLTGLSPSMVCLSMHFC